MMPNSAVVRYQIHQNHRKAASSTLLQSDWREASVSYFGVLIYMTSLPSSTSTFQKTFSKMISWYQSTMKRPQCCHRNEGCQSKGTHLEGNSSWWETYLLGQPWGLFCGATTSMIPRIRKKHTITYIFKYKSACMYSI